MMEENGERSQGELMRQFCHTRGGAFLLSLSILQSHHAEFLGSYALQKLNQV